MIGGVGKMPIRMALSGILPSEIVALRNNVSSAHFSSVTRGAGGRCSSKPMFQAIGAGPGSVGPGRNDQARNLVDLSIGCQADRAYPKDDRLDRGGLSIRAGFPLVPGKISFIPAPLLGKSTKGRPLDRHANRVGASLSCAPEGLIRGRNITQGANCVRSNRLRPFTAKLVRTILPGKIRGRMA